MMMVMVIGIAASACCSLVSAGGLGYVYSTGGMCESLEVGCEYTTLGNTTTVAADSNVTTDCFGWTTTQCTGKTGKARDTCMRTNKAACKLTNPTATWVTVAPGKTTRPPTGKFSLDKSFTKQNLNWSDSASALVGSKYSSGGYVSKKSATECGKICYDDSKCNAFAVANNADGTVGCWMKSGLVGSGESPTAVKTYLRKGYTPTASGTVPSGPADARKCLVSVSRGSGKYSKCVCSVGGDGKTDVRNWSNPNAREGISKKDCETKDNAEAAKNM